LFYWLASYVFLCFDFHRSDTTNLSSVMECVFCYGYNGFDENVYHVVRRWLVGSFNVVDERWTNLDKQWFPWRKRGIFLELSFSFACLLVCFVLECIEYRKNKQLGKNAPLWIFKFFIELIFRYILT
jgi:hypothetical protein